MVSDETRDKWKRKAESIIEANEIGALELNEWEATFMDSVSSLVSTGKDLSLKQSLVLNRIYDRIG